MAESFFATLEHELLAEADVVSREAARRAIFTFIEGWYNRERCYDMRRTNAFCQSNRGILFGIPLRECPCALPCYFGMPAVSS